MKTKKEVWEMRQFDNKEEALNWRVKQWRKGYTTFFTAQELMGKDIYFVITWKTKAIKP